MSFSVIVVSVIKQRARLKSLMLAKLKTCVMNIGPNTNGLCNRSAMNYYTTSVRDKSKVSKSTKSKHISDFQTDFLRCYSQNSSEFDKKHTPDSEGQEKPSENQGPVRMSITEEGKLHVHVVDDDINNNINALGKVNDDDELEKINDDNEMGKINDNVLGKINCDDNEMENFNNAEMGKIKDNEMGKINENEFGKINDNELGKINDNEMRKINDNELGKMDDDELDLGKIKVDSKFMELILANRTEDAIKLFQSAVAAGKSPQANGVVLLLQTLGKNGSVDDLLQLRHIVLDKKFCNELYFIKSLVIAYHESARIQDAVNFLKTLCENNQEYSKVKNLFIYLTTMILKKFPQWQSEIVLIVNEYKISHFPELEKELWKCYVLSENFKEAEKYVKETAELKEDIPSLVFELNSIIRNVTEFSDEEQIWKYLLVSGEDLGLSRGFLLVVYEEYLVSLLKKHKIRQVVLNLNKAKTNGIKIHKNRFEFLCRGVQESVLTEMERKMFKELTEWYQQP